MEIKDQWLGGIKGPNAQPGSAGILLYFRWFLKHSLLNANVLDQYDRFVITRSDYMHDVPHVPLRLLSPNYIWIPDGESYGGYTDRHIIVSRKHILSVLSITDPILATPDTLFEKMKHSQHWNMESYVKFAFGELGLIPLVKNFPFTMYTVRSVTGHTRWRAGVYNEKLGYCIKYKGEYIRTRFAAKCIKRAEQWNPLIMWLLMRSIDLLDIVSFLLKRLKKIRASIVISCRWASQAVESL